MIQSVTNLILNIWWYVPEFVSHRDMCAKLHSCCMLHTLLFYLKSQKYNQFYMHIICAGNCYAICHPFGDKWFLISKTFNLFIFHVVITILCQEFKMLQRDLSITLSSSRTTSYIQSLYLCCNVNSTCVFGWWSNQKCVKNICLTFNWSLIDSITY